MCTWLGSDWFCNEARRFDDGHEFGLVRTSFRFGDGRLFGTAHSPPPFFAALMASQRASAAHFGLQKRLFFHSVLETSDSRWKVVLHLSHCLLSDSLIRHLLPGPCWQPASQTAFRLRVLCVRFHLGTSWSSPADASDKSLLGNTPSLPLHPSGHSAL